MPYFFAFFAIAAIDIFWGGYVTALLWGWFMVPLGVHPINYWHAVGIGALLSVFLGSRGMPTDKKPPELILKGLLMVALIPFFSLLLGWLAKTNM